MPVDQTSPQFLGQLRDLAKGFLAWAGEESSEGHHPPNPGQHTQALQQPVQPDIDVNEPPPYPQKAAGMLLMAPDGRALFVRRQGDDHAGEWSLPGGMTKADEQPWQTARREAGEELGHFDCGDMQLLDHNYDGRLGYTTYGSNVNDAFTPTLNHEHDTFRWATPDQAPQPLHPGLKATLDFATDPLTEKGSKIMSAMQEQYGPEKGKSVFYASKNKGTISGVDAPDAIPTTHRQDTGIGIPAPTVHPAGRGGTNPYSANIDNQQHKLDFLPNTDHTGTWQSPRFDASASWTSPDWDAGTSEGARKAAQTRAGAGQSDPMGEYRYALRAQQREPGIGNFLRMVGKSMKVNPTQHPTMESADNKTPMQRYKLFDSHAGVLYDIDKPVPRSNAPSQDDWGETQASDPLTKPAMSAPQQQSTGRTGGLPMRSAPQPGAPMGGGPLQQRGVGMGGAMAGPKYSQSVKMSYPDGSVDERKMTRPGGPPPASQQWLSPKWQSPSGQQQADASWPTAPQPQPVTPRPDGGWPTAGSLGPSAMGGTQR